ncbi:GNAT family N-acetyltransferase [Allobranchiibius sp. GilTou38]|uniref:GNAT family N-acetyltransferase n=1 Tax=Allobranchiibius sp. GilTou38 TaxID=2815210 RepID=UPI001AA1D454|nr:GNAT family N-acetyltransferase [Allobranchiibius sp. GilTou38]MBO1765324.1 GNAT family N-acetyltransferase [Allobranchiibius sp. GilTou38]
MTAERNSSVDGQVEVRVVHSVDRMLSPETVEQIYAAASAQAPLSEPAVVATMYAGLYARARAASGLAMAIALDEGSPVGFAYGHDWSWGGQADAWSTQLRERIGDNVAQQIADSYAVELLAVLPAASGMGVGRRLLEELVDTAKSDTAWLQTTDFDSPARRLYRRAGWRTLGHGPDAPNGSPGLVLMHERTPTTDS